MRCLHVLPLLVSDTVSLVTEVGWRAAAGWTNRLADRAWREKGPVGCVEACLDEILALGPGDALGDRHGTQRMGGGARSGRSQGDWGLGRPGRSRGDVEDGGGDCEA